MSAAAVVEGFDEVEGQELGCGAGGWDGVAKAFGFEGGDEAFCQGVVVGIGRATHAQSDAAGGGELGEGRGSVLDTAIAVVEQAGRRGLAMNGEGEGRGGEFAAHIRTAVVGDAAPGAGVEGEGEEEPALGLARPPTSLFPSSSSAVSR